MDGGWPRPWATGHQRLVYTGQWVDMQLKRTCVVNYGQTLRAAHKWQEIYYLLLKGGHYTRRRPFSGQGGHWIDR